MGLLKKILVGVGGAVLLGGLGVGGYAFAQGRAFDASMEKLYELPLPQVTLSTEPAVLARGKHLTESLGGCTASDCHSPDFSGGRSLELGPVGGFAGPNITPGGMLAAYSDGELARLLATGVKKNGRSVLMMPVQDFSWLSQEDRAAMISYLRSRPASKKPAQGTTHVGLLGKVLDRQEKFPWDMARHVAALPQDVPPAPEPTAKYGRFIVRMCTGCHGDGLSGGPLPGAPPSLPIPLNLTPHDTGIKGYTYDDFVKVLQTGIRKNGKKVDPFMAVELTKNLNEVELKALWAEVSSRPAKPFGGR